MPTRRRADKFPLTLHPTGQYCKKHRGRTFYFGADRVEALKRFANEWDDIVAGRTPRPRGGDALTVGDLANHFSTAKRDRVDAGELSGGMWGEYYHCCEAVVGSFGRDRRVPDLRPADFGRLRAAASKRLGPVALHKFVTMTRTVFKFAFEAELIDAPPRYGNRFDKPAKRVRRGPTLIAAADARKLIDAADPQLRCMTLLALNPGLGATDLANLQRSALTVRPGWCVYPREKSGTPRKFPLWKESVLALEAVATVRPVPAEPADAGCVFLTRHGNRWVRFRDGAARRGVTINAVVGQFKDLARACGVELPGGFGVLRHTHRAIGDEVGDRPAAMLVMGHSDHGITQHHREAIADDRLQRVVDHVRGWLFAADPTP